MAPRSLSIITLSIISIIIISSSSMVESDSSVRKSVLAPPEAVAYIVYTLRIPLKEVEIHHLRTLSSVLGSEEAAKGALVYTYKYAACGFAAMLNPEQAEDISKQPGVLRVVKSGIMKLD